MIGQTISHYRIVEKIGAGGMGEVYRVHDERLDRDVALKILLAGSLADSGAVKLFRNEAQILCKLNHPNIATVHDFDSQDGVNFLVMEYITGETLDKRLAAGSVSEKEAVRLGLQLAQGLQAAHDAGIVHRDLKPGNLRITPDGRLKILDFGLSKLLQPRNTDITQSFTSSNTVAGTLPYMAPEQLKGEPADTRSDIYAAGAVLYEMVTGQRPFPETLAPRLIDAILHQHPQPPSAFNRQVPPGMQSLILKALEKDPAYRYQTAREMQVDLERLSASSAVGSNLQLESYKAPSASVIALPPKKILAFGLGAVLLIAVLLWLDPGGLRDRLFNKSNTSGGNSPVTSGAIRARRSVAVLGFKNLSKEPSEAWLSDALAEELTSELAAAGKLRTIPGEVVSRMKADLSLADAETYAPDTLDKIRRSISTDLVVFGSYLVDDKSADKPIRLDLRVQDTKNGETLASMVETGTQTELNALINRAGEALRQKLSAGEVSAAEAAELHASLPANSETARLYAEGLTKLRLFDAVAARDLLEKTVESDPKFALGHAALAQAWSELGNDAQAREEASKAKDLSSELSREDQLSIQGRYLELTADWQKAIETYRSLWEFFPDNLDYGLRLANVQTSAGKGEDALATVDEMRKLPAPLQDDPRIDLQEAAADKSLSDFKKEMAADERAMKKAEGAHLVSAQASLDECWALYSLGELESAKKSCDQAKDAFALAGDRKGSARSVTRLAKILETQGNLDAALALHQQALQNMREVGSRKDIAGALVNIANTQSDRGNLEGAKAGYMEALTISREDKDKQHVLEYENDLASVFYAQGDFPKAKDTYEQVLAAAREVNDSGGAAMALSNIGLVLYLQGDLAAAQKNLRDALNISEKLGMESDAAATLDALGDVLMARDDLESAGKAYRKAFDIRQKLGAKGDVANSKVSLGKLALEKGQAPQAEVLAREAVKEFQTEKLHDGEIQADDLLVRSLMAQGKLPEAQSVVEGATKLPAQDRIVRLSFAITCARLKGRSGKMDEASRELESALKDASGMKVTGFEFEARFAQAEIELESEKNSAARSLLQALEKQAGEKGFQLLARKAAAAVTARNTKSESVRLKSATRV
jgi:serine/threonine protein kinase/tetratricopeptide (TPR) repeat protein